MNVAKRGSENRIISPIASRRLSHLDSHNESSYSFLVRNPFGSAFMSDGNTDVIQGTLDMLILKTLSLGPLHGFGIARRVEQISQNVFKVNPGSLLTALQR